MSGLDDISGSVWHTLSRLSQTIPRSTPLHYLVTDHSEFDWRCFLSPPYITTRKKAWGHTTSLIQKHARSPLLQRKMMYHDIFIIFCNRDVTATSAEFQPRTLMVSIRRGQMTHKPCSYCGLQIDRWRAPQNVSDWLQHEFSVGPTTTLK